MSSGADASGTEPPMTPLAKSRFKPGCADHLSPPEPWQPLVLELTPGKQRPYTNIGSPTYRTPTEPSPLASEWVPFENRGSMVDLGQHPGASLRDFYRPSKVDPMVGRLNHLLGSYKGAKVDRTVKYFTNPSPKPYLSHRATGDFYQSNAGSAQKDDFGLGNESCFVRLFEKELEEPDALTVSRAELEREKQEDQRETLAFLQRYRTNMEALQEVQTKQKRAAEAADREEQRKERQAKKDLDFVENASRRQEILDRRPPWKEPHLAPGPGERHPVLTDPNEAGGTYKELLYGIYTDGGKTLPPHLMKDDLCPELHGLTTRFQYVNRASGSINYEKRPLKLLSPKEKETRRRLKLLTTKMFRSASTDALNASLGFKRRERWETMKGEELGKWMTDPVTGEVSPNTFYHLNGQKLMK